MKMRWMAAGAFVVLFLSTLAYVSRVGGQETSKTLATVDSTGESFVITNHSSTSSLLVFVSASEDSDEVATPPSEITVTTTTENTAQWSSSEARKVWVYEIREVEVPDCPECQRCSGCPVPPPPLFGTSTSATIVDRDTVR